MIRRLMIAAVAAALLPAGAEAAKMRYGGSRAGPPKAAAAPVRPAVVGAGVVGAPQIGRSSQTSGQPAANEISRAPFPPSSMPEPILLRLTTAEAPKAWCASEIVVGGFCVLN